MSKISSVFAGSTLVFFLLALVAACYAQVASTPEIKRDVTYAEYQGKPLLMDVYRIHNPTKPAPLVVCVHGGGWCSGSKQDVVEMAVGLARLGYCAACINYRLAPYAHFPDQLTDVKTAIKFMQNHAKEYNIDPSRVAIVGGSAGAHLALLVAVTDADSSAVRATAPGHPSLAKAVISIAGPTDLTRPLSKPALGVAEGLVGKPRADDMELFAKASPIHYVNANAAPMLLIHGDSDEIVPYSQAEELAAHGKKIGASVELFTLHHGGHAGGQNKEEGDQSIRLMVDFLARNLR